MCRMPALEILTRPIAVKCLAKRLHGELQSIDMLSPVDWDDTSAAYKAAWYETIIIMSELDAYWLTLVDRANDAPITGWDVAMNEMENPDGE